MALSPPFTGAGLQSLQLYRPRAVPFAAHIPFVLLYGILLQLVVSTVGQPRVRALERYAAMPTCAETGEILGCAPCQPLPGPYTANFYSMLGLGASVVLHLVLVLAQRWSVAFRCLVNFTPARGLAEATHAHCIPPAYHGRAELIPVGRTSRGRPCFEFQKFKYIWESPGVDMMTGEEPLGEGPNHSGDTPVFHQVVCPTDGPLLDYLQAPGLADDDQIAVRRERFGPNEFHIPLPRFQDLLTDQLLAPFSVFQFFCVALWMLDSYWQYSAFSLFMMFTFEASVAFSRLKSIKTLRSMGNPTLQVWVWRDSRWQQKPSTALLPGDLVSIVRSPNSDAAVPCDCLLLSGTAIVSEANLTGESIPQMKEAVSANHVEPDEMLDMHSKHKNLVLYGGTRVLQHTGLSQPLRIKFEDSVDAKQADADDHDDEFVVRPPPDQGCVCYVLRTGFDSSQGKLVRMIEFSSDKVKGDTRETLLLIGLLCLFALVASGYVLHRGLEAGTPEFELLLHCIMIVTSVIPPELNMQLSLAVNTSLMALTKLAIFCTAPFRIPLAGSIDTALFDKTGTLTTDKMVAVGVAAWPPVPLRKEQQAAAASALRSIFVGGGTPEETTNGNAKTASGKAASAAAEIDADQQRLAADERLLRDLLVDMGNTPREAKLVLAGCHSLMRMDGKTVGDPLEMAALRSIRWTYDAERALAYPVPEAWLRQRAQPKPSGYLAGPAPAASGSAAAQTGPPPPEDWPRVRLLHRHAFSSEMQRMSVLAEVQLGPEAPPRLYSLVKGSPERLADLMDRRTPGALPEWYESAHQALARRGMRVLALGFRERPEPVAEAGRLFERPREEMEAGLRFAGFIAFRCLARRDTRRVVEALTESQHQVIMITGDAVLTGIHVAQEVGIVQRPRSKVLTLVSRSGKRELPQAPPFSSAASAASPSEDSATAEEAQPAAVPELWWEQLDSDEPVARFDPEAVPALARDYDLCVAGAVFREVCRQFPSAKSYLALVRVFGRMKPQDKEEVLTRLKDAGHRVLMCGDGANDVGALKQAHVGLALLSGFGSANAAVEGTQAIAAGGAGAAQGQQRAAQGAPAGGAAAAAAGAVAAAGAPMSRAEEQAAKRAEFERRVAERSARGESFAAFKEMYTFMQAEAQAAKQKKMEQQRMASGTNPAAAGSLMAAMEGLDDGDTQMVKLGDASIAAPFTSKRPSIQGAVDVIRQGRSTLVTTLQMYQILALNCLISSYSLSALYLDNVKFGDRQMTATGILMTISYMSISRARPLDKLSPVRPVSSLFCKAMFLSLLGQFVVHLGVMVSAVALAKSWMRDADFDRNAKAEFSPNLLNTTVFLVSAVQNVAVFVVNYKGRPFMLGLAENQALLNSLLLVLGGVFVCASEVLPWFNELLTIVPFPSDGFRHTLLLLLLLNVGLCFVWDRLMVWLFEPAIFWAAWSDTEWDSKAIRKTLRNFAILAFVVNMLLQVEPPEE